MLRDIAARHAATPAQIFFRHLVLDGITPLSGTTSEAHMRDDLAIFQIPLEAHERELIGRLLEPGAGR